MNNLLIFHKSTGVLTAHITDDNGADVDSATVTVTIVPDDGGAALVTAASMAFDVAGKYDYTISNTLLPNANRDYVAQVTAVDSGNTRYAEVTISSVIDAD